MPALTRRSALAAFLASVPGLATAAREALAPLAGLTLRAHLEGAAQTALEAADRIMAALDRIEGAGTAPDPRIIVMASHAPPVAHLREPTAPVA